MRRALWETLIDMAESVAPEGNALPLRVTHLEIEAPIEVQMRQVGGEMQFFAEAPRRRWRSAFDARPGRLQIGRAHV